MNKKIMAGLAVFALFLTACTAQAPQSDTNSGSNNAAGTSEESKLTTPPQSNDAATSGQASGSAQGGAMQAGQSKEFTVEGGNFKFSLPEMKVKKGDTVKVTFVNKEGFHDWVLDEFTGAKTKQLQAGQQETIEFVADKIGTFEYYCSVGKHREMGMKGKLIVE